MLNFSNNFLYQGYVRELFSLFMKKVLYICREIAYNNHVSQHHNMTTTSLSAYIASLNAATLAWVAEDSANRFACTYTEDMSYWNEMGVFTVEDFQRNELESTAWDLYKSVNGIRPRWINFKEMSIKELEAFIENLQEAAKWQAERDAAYEAQRKIEDAWRAEVDAHEATLCIPGELQFIRGTWAIA